MKKYLLLLTAFCLMASLAACNNNNTSEQINSDISSEQQATAESTNTPEVKPTQEAEPTETPVVKETPTEIEIPDGELPDGYSYNEETKILTYLYEFAGEMHEINYPGVDRAGADENGNVAFYSDETNQEVWFVEGLTLFVIDHSEGVTRFLQGFTLVNKPQFTKEKEELKIAYYSKAERDIAAMYEGLDGNYSQELKDFIQNECITMIEPRDLEVYIEEIEFLNDLFNDIAKPRSLYPSSYGRPLYSDSSLTNEESKKTVYFMYENGLKEKYPEGIENASSLGITCNYLFNDSDEYFIYYQNSINTLMEFANSPSEITYNNYIKSTFAENIPVEIAVINGLYISKITAGLHYQDELGNDIKININGTDKNVGSLIGELSGNLNEIYKSYRNESSNLGDIMIQDYMQQLGLEIPELATIDDE